MEPVEVVVAVVSWVLILAGLALVVAGGVAWFVGGVAAQLAALGLS